MTWSAAGGVLGGALGALGNKQRGPSLAQNMADMGSVFGQNSALTANAGYRDLGPASYYPGNTYAGLSPQTQQALQQLMGGANSPALGAANNYLQGAASGQYLNSNPANAQLGGMAGSYGMGGYNTVAPQLFDIAGRAGGYDANPAAAGLDYFGSGGELNNKQFNDFSSATALTQFFDKPNVFTPRVLKDGSDSVGALGALKLVLWLLMMGLGAVIAGKLGALSTFLGVPK